ncbi:hypothetical protein PM082_018712 [Marasmius tenuissimus]|nr:hypothetical protein PM082_018712 [Marasmius tenuissimus]
MFSSRFLKFCLTLWLVLPQLRGFDISSFPLSLEPGETTAKSGSITHVPWSREPDKDPQTFEFVWVTSGSGDLHFQRTNIIVNLNDTNQKGETTDVPFPQKPGPYRLAIFGVPFAPANEPLFTDDQEVVVEPLDGSMAMPPRGTPTNAIDTTQSGSSSQRTTQSPANSTSSLSSGTTPKNTPASQPSNASQTHNSGQVPLAPMVGGVIGGVLVPGLAVFAIRCYLRKRRSKSQGSLDIDPFPAHLSEPKVCPPESDGTASQQRHEQPDINQDDIATRDVGRNPDTKVDPLPLVHLQYAGNTISATPPVENGLEGPNVARATTSRPELEVFTTDELVVALNQRLQEEGRWEIEESLPGYPESNQGRSS